MLSQMLTCAKLIKCSCADVVIEGFEINYLRSKATRPSTRWHECGLDWTWEPIVGNKHRLRALIHTFWNHLCQGRCRATGSRQNRVDHVHDICDILFMDSTNLKRPRNCSFWAFSGMNRLQYVYTHIPFDEAIFWVHSGRDGLQYEYTILYSKWVQIDLLFTHF